MLKKRIVGVVTVKDGWAVQSSSYSKYLPLGRPELIAENLDRWGVDEILLQSIDRSRSGLGPDLDLLDRVSKFGLGTPLIYGGGISTVQHGQDVVRAGADRVVLDCALHSNSALTRSLSLKIGQQAIIGCLPVSFNKKRLEWFDYVRSEYKPLDKIKDVIINSVVSEWLIVDPVNEGKKNKFDAQIIEPLRGMIKNIIVFGGISEPQQIEDLSSIDQVVAICVGNFLNYSELAVNKLMQEVNGTQFRDATRGFSKGVSQ
ncbi:HisA/HisF-related TIM barrel protein [Candidatus Puniceispirillum sp.]|nr:HisA/HisF-related TIM barrel protein [Candidatus Puniceispirillum sp.]